MGLILVRIVLIWLIAGVLGSYLCAMIPKETPYYKISDETDLFLGIIAGGITFTAGCIWWLWHFLSKGILGVSRKH